MAYSEQDQYSRNAASADQRFIQMPIELNERRPPPPPSNIAPIFSQALLSMTIAVLTVAVVEFILWLVDGAPT
jgi:hypothetical protein